MSFANLATERQRVGLWKEKSDRGPKHKRKDFVLSSSLPTFEISLGRQSMK